MPDLLFLGNDPICVTTKQTAAQMDNSLARRPCFGVREELKGCIDRSRAQRLDWPDLIHGNELRARVPAEPAFGKVRGHSIDDILPDVRLGHSQPRKRGQSLHRDPVWIDRLPGRCGLREGPALMHAGDPTRSVRATVDPQKAGCRRTRAQGGCSGIVG